jgi:hypothetical protein
MTMGVLMDVSISDPVFTRLQKHANPLVDTMDDVLTKLLDAVEKAFSSTAALPKTTHGIVDYPAAAAPSLKHAVLRQLMVDGNTIDKEVFWNTLLLEVIRTASKRGLAPEEIAALLHTPVKLGQHKERGFRFVEDAGLSFQQLNSDRAWAESYRIASKLGIPVLVRWVWQNNEKAHSPGNVGRMEM